MCVSVCVWHHTNPGLNPLMDNTHGRRQQNYTSTGMVAERELPVFPIPPPENNSSARQLKIKAAWDAQKKRKEGVAPQTPFFALKKRVLR